MGYEMHKKRMSSRQLSNKVLGQLERELSSRDIQYLGSRGSPYHRVVIMGDHWISFYCGGLSKVIEIQPLRKNGLPDMRYQEVVRLTAVGAVNFFFKKYRK